MSKQLLLLSNSINKSDHLKSNYIIMFDNVLIGENGTAIVISAEHAEDRKLIVEIKWNDQTIASGMGEWFSYNSKTHKDLVLAHNTIMTERDDVRQKKQTIKVIIKPVISLRTAEGEYKWNSRRRRREANGNKHNIHIPQDAIDKATILDGKYREENKASGYYWDPVCEEEIQFNFYIFNFRDHAVAEKLLATQPAERFWLISLGQYEIIIK